MFRKVGFLGKGSYGTVHRALGPSGDSFAVKSSPFDMSSSLHKEERVYADFIDFPEVVQCYCGYSSIEGGTRLYNLVLEYANEGSLRTLMSRYPGRRLPNVHVKEFTRMLLRGLSQIHEFGYVHCDLKPDNILVFRMDSGGRLLKLADFGLAKEPESGEDRCHRRFRGTPWYMSPELVLYGELGPKLDIWSLGCVVIEMVTGWPAYGAILDRDELARKIGKMQEAPEIPEDLCVIGKDFLARCLAVDPRERWSANDLLGHPFLAESSWSSQLGTDHHLIIQEGTNLPLLWTQSRGTH